MKKFFLFIAVVVVVAGGYYWSTKDAVPSDPRVAAAETMLTGSWSNEDDRNFIREYMDGGKVVDSHASAAGETKVEAEWSLFTSVDAPEVEFQLNNSDVYIMQTEADGSVSYYRVVNITPTELELMSMDSAEASRFGKMTTGHELQDGSEE